MGLTKWKSLKAAKVEETKKGKSTKYVRLTSRGLPKAKSVEPIRNVKDIEKIKRYLKGKDCKRDYCLFIVGINLGLRASDLLVLKIGDVLNRDSITVIEKKTNKDRKFDINQSCKDAINLYLEERKNYSLDDYLFKSKKGGCLNVSSAHKIIKTLMKELHIEGNFGTHTLRKTFCYHVYKQNAPTDPSILATLQDMLNHTSTKVTLRYMGITQDVISNIYRNLNL